MAKSISEAKRKKLRRDISFLFDEYRISKRDLAMSVEMDHSLFCKIVSGSRPIALSKHYEEIRGVVDTAMSNNK